MRAEGLQHIGSLRIRDSCILMKGEVMQNLTQQNCWVNHRHSTMQASDQHIDSLFQKLLHQHHGIRLFWLPVCQAPLEPGEPELGQERELALLSRPEWRLPCLLATANRNTKVHYRAFVSSKLQQWSGCCGHYPMRRTVSTESPRGYMLTFF